MALLALGGATGSLAFVLVAAFVAGVVDSLVGGGGLIQVPALLAAFPSIAAPQLLATNKLGSICGTASAVSRYARFVDIPWRTLLPGAVVACLAALGGASVVSRVSPAVFRPLVPIMLSLVLAYVLWDKTLGATHAPIILSRKRRGCALALIGAIGFYDGFFGPGTGSFLMLLFVRVYGFDFLHASAGARVVNVATNAGALLLFGLHSQVHWALGLALGAMNASGSVVGIRAARRHGTRLVRRLFIVVVMALIAKTGYDAWRS